MKCPNCQKQLTCGCQKRVASDGKQVCSSCFVSYEAFLTAAKTRPVDSNYSKY